MNLHVSSHEGFRKKPKRVAAILLSLCIALLMFPLNLLPTSAYVINNGTGTETSGYYVLKHVIKSAQLSFQNNSYEYKSENHNFDTGLDSVDNLAVYFNLYIENRDNPDNIDLFTKSQYCQIKWHLPKDTPGWTGQLDPEVYWMHNTVKNMGLKPGWNAVLLKFPTKQMDPNDTKPGIPSEKCDSLMTKVNTFRIYFQVPPGITDRYIIRVSNVALVDTSRPEQPPEPPPVWENSHIRTIATYCGPDEVVGRTTNNPNGGTPALTIPDLYPDKPVDITGHDPSKIYLSIDMYFENETHPGGPYGDAFSSGAIKIYDKTTGKANRFTRYMHFAHAKPGVWNTLLLPFSQIDLDNNPLVPWENYGRMQIYFDSINHTDVANRPGCHPNEAGSSYILKIRNVKIVDITNDMQLSTLFSDGMMFQQHRPIKIWGSAVDGNTVVVSLIKENGGDGEVMDTQSCQVENGEWEVEFEPLPGSMEDVYRLIIQDTKNGEVVTTKEIRDILIGEVWVAGGQSNMQAPVRDDLFQKEILEEADNHKLRFFIQFGYTQGEQPLQPSRFIPSSYWGYGDDPSQVSNVSSVGYNFIKNLSKKLDVPVGLLYTPVGGTCIEAWISRDAIDKPENLDYKNYLFDRGKYCDEFNWPDNHNRMSALYNQKIGPYKGYYTAGAIWYQGESNIDEAPIYARALEILHQDWSETFGFTEFGETMPFIYTQLAPFYYNNTTNYSTPLTIMAYMSEAMSDYWQKAKDNGKTAQVTIYDLPLTHIRVGGHSGGAIHPSDKRPVAERLATAAYNMVYDQGQKAYSAPVYKSMTIDEERGSIFVTFDSVGDGLKIKPGTGGDLHGFAIAGEDGVYYPARARIVSKDTVEVWNVTVENPRNVTYAFTSFNAEGNLLNSIDIAAVPFRTDRQAEDSKLLYNQGWVYADGEVWVTISDSIQNELENFRFMDLWVTDGEHTYDKTTKAEGDASLKVQYQNGGDIKMGPAFGVRSVRHQFERFGRVSVQIKNGDNRQKQLGLMVTSGGKTYLAQGINTTSTWLTVSPNSDFTTYFFNLQKLMDGDTVASNPMAILKEATAFQFVIKDQQGGTIWLDDVMFGQFSENEERAPVPKSVTGVTIKTMPAKTKYAPGEALDPTGGVVTVTYDDGSSIDLPMTIDMLSGYDPYGSGEQTVTLTVEGKSITFTVTTYQFGDVNGDGAVTTTDARLALQTSVSKITLDATQQVIADVNGDERITATDARLILQFAVNKITQFPIQVEE